MALDSVSARRRRLVYVALATEVALIVAWDQGWVTGAVPLVAYWLVTAAQQPSPYRA